MARMTRSHGSLARTLPSLTDNHHTGIKSCTQPWSKMVVTWQDLKTCYRLPVDTGFFPEQSCSSMSYLLKAPAKNVPIRL